MIKIQCFYPKNDSGHLKSPKIIPNQKKIHIKCHKISHLQMNIFSNFSILDSRRNALVAGMDRSELTVLNALILQDH